MRLSTTAVRNFVVLVAAFALFSCSDYEYSSPEPGIIEVRLKVINNRQELLPFTRVDSVVFPAANMIMVLRTLHTTQSNGALLPVYSDLQAIRRNPDGDFYNCLTTLARDSALTLGQAYAPPEQFSGLQMVIDSPFGVDISYGFYGSFIPVTPVLPFVALQALSASIPVESGRTTRIVVALDLDRSLIQLTESYLFQPVFFISSVEIL
jgi:hypothetical protein